MQKQTWANWKDETQNSTTSALAEEDFISIILIFNIRGTFFASFSHTVPFLSVERFLPIARMFVIQDCAMHFHWNVYYALISHVSYM